MPALCSNLTFIFENPCDVLAIHSRVLDGHERRLALDAEQTERPPLKSPSLKTDKRRAEFALQPEIFFRGRGVHFIEHILCNWLIFLGVI